MFSGPLAKSTLLGLISAESVNIWSAVASSLHVRSFGAFNEPPRGAWREVPVAGYVGRPGSFPAGWRGAG